MDKFFASTPFNDRNEFPHLHSLAGRLDELTTVFEQLGMYGPSCLAPGSAEKIEELSKEADDLLSTIYDKLEEKIDKLDEEIFGNMSY